MNTYVELHLHSNYSFLDGASRADELVLRAQELGYQALAITDHDGVHGALEFARLAADAGIQPITGAEITLVDGSHITLLAESQLGYQNLCKLLTAAHRTVRTNTTPWLADDESKSWDDQQDDDDAPGHYRDAEHAAWLDPLILRDYTAGLILLTGCRRGPLARLIEDGRFPEARRQLRQFVEWFGPDNVFVELQHNFVAGDAGRIDRLVALADAEGVPYVATGNVHYHRRDRHRLQDVLVAIRHRTTLDGSHRQRRPNAEFALVAPEEMARRYRRYPEAIANTGRIAERCKAFDLNLDLGYTFPDYPCEPGETPDDALARICSGPFAERYPPESPQRHNAEARLAEELRLIRHHGLAGFFLIHHDLLVLAREVAVEVRGNDSARAQALLPPGRGRGSSVSSIVCYLIGLSPVDPLEHKLSLGRFLNEQIRSIPDIDLDFPRDIREQLIARIHADYGDRAAMVCAFSTYRLRSAVRDVGKALGLPLPDLDRVARLSEPGSARALASELDKIPGFAARKEQPPWSYLIELAEQLAGFPRHITQHSGGMIVSSGPITDLVPVQPAAMDGRFLCQWDKDSCDDARFVKIDFLALGMLSLVEESMSLIAEAGDTPPDLSRIDFTDPAVYKMIQEGDTIGTFQIESRAQIQTVLKTQPRDLNDLTVQVAIVRPGPIVGGATTPYIQSRQQGWFEPVYEHPLLEPVLKETYGIILYQEQVVDVAVALAGFTPGQADALRRSMTRKRSLEAMTSLWEEFRRGAAGKGVSEEIARKVFDRLLGFSSYGFPKAHAASFAVLAYQSCWLKRYYPAEFLCGLLNNQPMGFYPPHVLVNDGKRHGIRVVPPSINASRAKCHVEYRNDRAVRVGLAFVKGLSEDEANLIVAERTANGPYRSLPDFVRRISLRTEAIEQMISVGAFDEFGLSRREALWQVGLFIPNRRFGNVPEKRRKANQHRGVQLSLALPVAQDEVTLPTTTAWERMAADYQIIGMSPHYHPLGLLRPRLPAGIVSTREMIALPDGANVKIGGLIVCRQRPGTAKGVTFLLLEDEHDLINIVVYASLYEAQRPIVRSEPFVLVEGTIQREDRNLNLIATRFTRLEDLLKKETGRPATVREIIEQEREGVIGRNIAPSSHNYR